MVAFWRRWCNVSGDPGTNLTPTGGGSLIPVTPPPDPRLSISELQAVASFIKQFDSPVVRWSMTPPSRRVLRWEGIVIVAKALLR